MLLEVLDVVVVDVEPLPPLAALLPLSWLRLCTIGAAGAVFGLGVETFDTVAEITCC